MGIKFIKSVELLMFFVLVFLVSCSCDKSPTDGGNNHYDPRNVSRREGYDVVPTIAVDNMGTVHIVWSNTLDLWYSYKTSGGDWSELENITNTLKVSHVPAMAVDNSNNLHLVWREGEWGEDMRIYYSMHPADSTWMTPVRISESYGDIPSMGVDDADNVHVAWWGFGAEYRMKSLGGIWSPIEEIPLPDGANLSLAVSRDGAVHVASNVGGGGFVKVYYTMKPFDASWTQAVRISENSTVDAYPPEIAVDEDDYVYVSWREGKKLPFRIRNPDGNWGEIDSIPDIEGYPYATTVDADDNGIYFVWEARIGESNDEIYYKAKYSDSTWSDLLNLSDTAGMSWISRYGSFLKHGLLHITWQDDTPGNWDVFYTVIETR